MRSRILTAFLVAISLAPAWSARAQDQEQPEEENSEGSETEGADVSDEGTPGKRMGPKIDGARETAPGEVHTVVKGDTLWDLSQQYLGSPWYWPKVWSYNPEIANPHWIYPGNKVRFFPAGEEVPSRVETGTAPADSMVVEEGEVQAATELGPANGESLVSVSGVISYKASGATLVTTRGFVTSKEVDEAGKIDSSFSEMEMMSFPDTVYLRFKKKVDAKVGDRYLVYRTNSEVKHPITGKKAGYLTDLVGTVRVLSVGDKFVTAQISESWDGMYRGDLVGPYGERLMDRVSAKPNTKAVKGYIITAMLPFLTITGEHNFLVIDRGSADGVEVGNTFSIVRRENPGVGNLLHPTEKEKEKAKALPDEVIGTCLVSEVKERTSNCLLVTSIREIAPGERVEMRVGAAPTASR
ncbi:LysM peptidoglycan-binding domain-containing protein [Hyalangium versicolor]|uniref:LysM peptidoglycan-binding domain-containing protein n=1 Tax=Hyalangium versicolor TaxID=2861190 RepID=UPI001CCF8952|nr:LysM domain-containing protein [Hyalangium versicolor]